MVELDEVRAILQLGKKGWGAKRIASALGLARNTVRAYLRRGERTSPQVRPGRRCLNDEQRKLAVQRLAGEAAGNATVVQRRHFSQEGVEASLRTVE